MQEVWVTPTKSFHDMKMEEGCFFDPDDSWTILDGSEAMLHVRCRETGKTICMLHRHAIPASMCDLAVRCFYQAGKMVSTNRGVAAGQKQRERHQRFEKGVAAHSAVVGYMDSHHHNRPCRLTAFSEKHFEKYQEGIPFIEAMDACFRQLTPREHAVQCEAISRTPYRIGGTAFSTVTVNYNFRTALHCDKGDFAQGFGNLVVCAQDTEGGMLLFPRYNVAIDVRTGDFLAMNVHEWHCNSTLRTTTEQGFRLSFVCYFRSKLADCAVKQRRLERFGSTMTVDDICKTIFDTVGEPLPAKVSLGVGKQGIEWWEYVGQRVGIRYKYKRYTVIDKVTPRVIPNLWTGLEYILGQHLPPSPT
jgi:hypothetical protein